MTQEMRVVVWDEVETHRSENMNIEKSYQIVKHRGVLSHAHLIKETELITMYVDYFNNFLSVERFAEYYSTTLDSAEFIINKGRELLNH